MKVRGVKAKSDRIYKRRRNLGMASFPGLHDGPGRNSDPNPCRRAALPEGWLTS